MPDGPPKSLQAVVWTVMSATAAGYLTYFVAQHDPLTGGWVVPFLIIEAVGATILVTSRPSGSRSKRSNRYVIPGVVGGVLLLCSLAVPVQWPTWSGSIQFDGTNPTETSCSNPAHDTIVREWKLYRPGSHVALVDAQLRHSPHCGTSWVRAKALQSGISLTKEIRRPGSFLVLPTGWEVVKDTATELWTYGYQVSAPGCVDTKIIAKSASKVVASSIFLCSKGS